MSPQYLRWFSSGVALAGLLGTASGVVAESSWAPRARAVVESRLSACAGQESAPADRTVDHLAGWRAAAIGIDPPDLTFALAADGLAEPATQPGDASGPADGSDEPTAQSRPAVERGPLPGFFETVERDLKELPRTVWDDTQASFGNKGNLAFLLVVGGVSAGLRPEVDDDIEDYYDRQHSFKEDWRDAFGAMGNPVTHFALAGLWYLVGQQAQDIKTYEVGKRAISALGITGAATMLLKAAANTGAPNGEHLGWPSGHVSSTMAFATVMYRAYGPWVGVPLFGLTGLVGVERLDSGEHHFSDLVFGAALGWVVAETVMQGHQPELFGGTITPYIDPQGGSAGLAWVCTLGT